MEQQIIKYNKTQGKWEIKNTMITPVHMSRNIATVNSALLPIDESTANGLAIISAVNNTYNIGISPDKVKELYKMLEQVYVYGIGDYNMMKEINDLLQSAKLK